MPGGTAVSADAARDNNDKPRLSDLFHFGIAIDRLVSHMNRGRAKYPDVNGSPNFLLAGKPDTEYLDAIMRHTRAIQQGEVYDIEGYRHDAAIAWNALALSVNNYPSYPCTQAPTPADYSNENEDAMVYGRKSWSTKAGFYDDSPGAIIEWPDDAPLPHGPPYTYDGSAPSHQELSDRSDQVLADAGPPQGHVPDRPMFACGCAWCHGFVRTEGTVATAPGAWTRP